MGRTVRGHPDVTNALRAELTRIITDLLEPDIDEDDEDALTVALIRLSPDPLVLDYLFNPNPGDAFGRDDGSVDVDAVVDRIMAASASAQTR